MVFGYNLGDKVLWTSEEFGKVSEVFGVVTNISKFGIVVATCDNINPNDDGMTLLIEDDNKDQFKKRIATSDNGDLYR